ncbi:Phosphate-binding protein PstS 2 family protein [Streptococcus ictaluri 707-05]|uniref:Phosphate-binding protein PstS 2 family protein n=1 Tax=Streptococcus ictaluri 707-05 TaxID=764299 RepID=G5K246_9STRE|nr:Phosphate-binding protein PstS 2 family protein [Streptococcus ictaluri 707-05]
MTVKKMLTLALIGFSSLGLVACGNNSTGSQQETSGKIEVISREDGSGTIGAFTEIIGILKKDGDKEVDKTTKSAVIQNSTEGVISAVQGNVNAIGYISLGSLNSSVKALKVDGVEASGQTVLDGEYPLQRPFNIVWSSDLSEVGQDFIRYIHSKEGQQVVTKNKFIEAKSETSLYTSKALSGKLTIVGSTSVSP